MPVYVQHEMLGKVADVFNAESLWQAPGLALFSRRPLLRDLLERSPREQRGRAATRCFSHVSLLLPQDEVDDDRHLSRGARLRDLAASLAALHRKDFGDLLGEDEVRYDIAGADTLEAGQVEVRFGHAVYLPAADEPVLYQIATSSDTAIWQPVGPLYMHQRLALIDKDSQPSAALAGLDATILLINDGADAPLEVQVRPKQAYDCSFDANGGYYVIRARDASARRLLLKVSRVGPPARAVKATAAAPASVPSAPTPVASASAQHSAAVWKTRSPVGATPSAEQTAVPLPRGRAGLGLAAIAAAGAAGDDATYAPLARQRVSLAALALPRLSRYRETGAAALEIGFDRQLNLAAAGADTIIGFSVDAADELFASTAAGSQRIAAPALFTPIDGASVRLLEVAAAMAERYRALLVLPMPTDLAALPQVAVTGGARFVFGRGAPMLAALRVLDSPRFLRQAEGAAAAASADRIGLSRQAFSFEASAAGYQIGRLSATQALYHLDAQFGFVGAINDDQPYLLPPGHHLVAGHYVLRFDA